MCSEIFREGVIFKCTITLHYLSCPEPAQPDGFNIFGGLCKQGTRSNRNGSVPSHVAQYMKHRFAVWKAVTDTYHVVELTIRRAHHPR